MAQVILMKNLFVGYRIRKAQPIRPRYTYQTRLKRPPKDAVIVSRDEEADLLYKAEVEDIDPVPSITLRSFDAAREMNDIANERVDEVSVSIITSNAAQLIKNAGIDPAAVIGTGKDGRVTQNDVLKHIEEKG